MANDLLDTVRPLLEPGEKLDVAFTGQIGIWPGLARFRGIVGMLAIANRPRIIAITDRRIVVFRAGHLRWNRDEAEAVLYAVPRGTVLAHGRRSWSRVAIGNERIWVSREAYPFIDAANTPPPPAEWTGFTAP